MAVSFEVNRCRRKATLNESEEEQREGKTGLTTQQTTHLDLDNVFGYSALEQGSVYKTWGWDYCLTS